MPTEIQFRSRVRVESFQNRSSQTVASLEIEMTRAQRYERPLSVVTFTLETEGGRGGGGPDFRQLGIDKKMLAISPDVLRFCDFWGRIEKLGFVIVLTETPLDGIKGVIDRLVAHPQFEQLLSETGSKSSIVLGGAEFKDGMARIEDFVKAAKENPIWSSLEAATAEAE